MRPIERRRLEQEMELRRRRFWTLLAIAVFGGMLVWLMWLLAGRASVAVVQGGWLLAVVPECWWMVAGAAVYLAMVLWMASDWWRNRRHDALYQDLFAPLRGQRGARLTMEEIHRILVACAAEVRSVLRHLERARRCDSFDRLLEGTVVAWRDLDAVQRCLTALEGRIRPAGAVVSFEEEEKPTTVLSKRGEGVER